MGTALICGLLLQYGAILSVYEHGKIFHLLLLSSIDFIVVLQFSLQWSLSSLGRIIPTVLVCSFLFWVYCQWEYFPDWVHDYKHRGNFLCVSLYPAGMFNFCHFYGSFGRVFSLSKYRKWENGTLLPSILCLGQLPSPHSIPGCLNDKRIQSFEL